MYHQHKFVTLCQTELGTDALLMPIVVCKTAFCTGARNEDDHPAATIQSGKRNARKTHVYTHAHVVTEPPSRTPLGSRASGPHLVVAAQVSLPNPLLGKVVCQPVCGGQTRQSFVCHMTRLPCLVQDTGKLEKRRACCTTL